MIRIKQVILKKKNACKVLQTPREERKGGGILCLFKGEHNAKNIPPPFSIKQYGNLINLQIPEN